jgi:site-specific recombinase XerD
MSHQVQKDERGRFARKESSKIRVDRYFDYISAIRSAQTSYTYVAAVRRFEEFLDDSKILLSEAPSGLLDDFVVWMSKRKLSPATIKLTLSGVRNYTDWCRKHEKNGCPVFDQPKVPKVEAKTPFILTADQLEQYFREVLKLKEPSRTALLIVPYCGLRVTELCRVELNRISSEEDKHGKRWTLIEVKGKGGKIRKAPLLPQASEILVRYLQGWRANQRKSKWLFPGKNNAKRFLDSLSPSTLQAHLRNIRQRIKLSEDLTPHILRKTCFTHLYRRGMSIQTIALIAGHESTETTMKYYIASSSKDVLNELGDVIER